MTNIAKQRRRETWSGRVELLHARLNGEGGERGASKTSGGEICARGGGGSGRREDGEETTFVREQRRFRRCLEKTRIV